ncbi:hypothetical protein LXT21_44595 [Myxococcus sp. K38C18041901]|uniref:hypothetical protein n=1 Tax=Myxococcus guangdongensis TaxID=2906760 RepID=UPI0020A6FA23|nr:hypothetical protein [Myxococcus guangdongensis]MCP3065865.1 hypothetical protein [Myxococcus guangdongensis]
MADADEDLQQLLVDVESALSSSREHNSWDLGPSGLLVRVRDALKKVPSQAK